ncbi:MAG: DUF3015 family protein [Bacteriovoracia bacterium]
MKLSSRLAFLTLVAFLSFPAFAAKNAWRQCGIGAMIFPKTGWAAVTSNLIWDLGITATTSSSSSESQCAGRASTAAKFIHQNYAVLEEETATGAGDHLATVLNILNCKNGSHGEIINSVRSNFAQEIEAGTQSDEAYFNNLMNVIESSYSTQCQLS